MEKSIHLMAIKVNTKADFDILALSLVNLAILEI